MEFVLLKSKHNYRKENQSELIIFPASDILIREEDYQRGQLTLEKQILKTLSPILKSYLEEILSSFHQKQSHADSREIFIFVL